MLTTHPTILHKINLQNDSKLISLEENPTTLDLNRLGKILMHAGKFYKGENEDLFEVFDRLKNCSCSIIHKQKYQHYQNNQTYKVIDLTNGRDEILFVGGFKDDFTDDKTCNNFSYLLAIKESNDSETSTLKTITITYGQAPRDLIDEFDNIELIAPNEELNSLDLATSIH